jgi:hypothetical protein
MAALANGRLHSPNAPTIVAQLHLSQGVRPPQTPFQARVRMRIQVPLPMLLVALGIAATACRSAPSASADTAVLPASAPAPVPCGATVQDVNVTAWREVAAEGFRFCVPPDWRVSDRTWRHGGARLTWGLGAPPSRQRVATAVVAVPASELGAAGPGSPIPDSDVRRFSEDIGGHLADLWRNRFGRSYYTGAEWSSPRVWLVGDAQDPATADLQITVFRTVRFTAN